MALIGVLMATGHSSASVVERRKSIAIVGVAVRRLREARKLSQEGFAARCGLHRTFVGGIERAERNITLETLEATPRRFNVHLDTDKLPMASEMEVLGLWERPVGDVIIRRMRAANVTFTTNCAILICEFGGIA